MSGFVVGAGLSRGGSGATQVVFHLVAADPTSSVSSSPILKPVAEGRRTGILRRLLVRILPRVGTELCSGGCVLNEPPTRPASFRCCYIYIYIYTSFRRRN